MGNAEYMGTHPIFESDSDCLTDFVSDMRVELCHFSGLKIYPGHGMNHCKADGKVIRLLSSKNAALYHNKTNPRKLRWTILYRRKHKKGISQEASVKRRVRPTSKWQRPSPDSPTTNCWPRNNKSQRSDRSSATMPSGLQKRRRRLTRRTRRLRASNQEPREPNPPDPRAATSDQCPRVAREPAHDDNSNLVQYTAPLLT